MRLLLLLLLALLSAPAWAQTIAITNARLIDGTRDEAGVTIVISGGKVESIASGGAAPAGARTIDAGGQPVTSTLFAAATQIGLVGLGGAPDTDDRGVTSGPLGAAFDVSRAVDPNALTIQEARAQGVSRAMIFPNAGNGVFAGTGALLHLDPGPDPVRKARAAMFASGDGKEAGGSRGAVWTLIRNALDEAKRPAGTGNAPRDDLLNPVDIAALQPVVAGRMPLAIAVNREADIRQAAAIAADYGIRVVIIGGAEAWRAADLLAARGIAVILDPLDELPFSYAVVGARRDNAALLAKAGVPIAFMVSGQGIYLSWDVGPALREGAGIAVANGLPYSDALQAITTAPARIWTGASTPALAPGAQADLVIWDGDPLEPSSAPAHVIIGGREISLETRQTLLRDRYHPGRRNDPLPPGYR
ncbi:MAG: amidohydrolase family protein [Novosphingobium sp.]|nr:amidohydrolase family protein [Novosphingobium sp.]